MAWRLKWLNEVVRRRRVAVRSLGSFRVSENSPENRFWVGQNVFVVMAGGGVVIVPEHHVWGGVCILVGVVGFFYSRPNAPVKPTWNSALWICAILLTWAAIAFDYFDRHSAPSTMQTSVRNDRREFLASGANGSAPIENLQPGKTTAMNLGITNYGPLPALDAALKCEIRWLAPMTKSVEDDVWEDFEKTAIVVGPRDLDVAMGLWQTYYSPPLSEEALHEIQAGGKSLYVFMHYEYTDNGGRHSTDSCLSLSTPLQPGPTPGSVGIVWSNCIGHNKIR